MSILFVTHNLGVVAEIADDVAVMYAGRVVESAPVARPVRRTRSIPTRRACSPAFRTPRATASASGERLRLNPIPGNVPPHHRPAARLHLRAALPLCDDPCDARAVPPWCIAHGRTTCQPLLEACRPMSAAAKPSASLLRVEGLSKHFADARGGVVKAVDGCQLHGPARHDRRPRRRIRLRQDHGRAAACCAWSSRTAGGSLRRRRPAHPVGPRACGPIAGACRSSSRIPYSSLNPRLRVGEIIGEALDTHGLAKGAARRDRASPSCSDRVGLDPDACPPLPARVLRRPAPAHRHRPRARGRAGVHRRRRAGLGARRLGPGAGPQPAPGSAADAWASPCCSSPTTSRWWNISATTWW